MSRTVSLDRLVVVVVAACLAAAGLVATTGSAARADASTLYQLLNQSRAAAGKPALVRDSRLDKVAQDWTAKMVASGVMKHNPSYSTQVPRGWTSVAENVASRFSTDSALHRAWMNSPGHRVNILGSYTSVGIGWVKAPDGGIWATQVFAAYPGVRPPATVAPVAPVVVAPSPQDSSTSVTAGPPPSTALATFSTTARTAQLRRISSAGMQTSQDLGGGMRGEPSVVERGGALEVYVRGTNDRLYVRTGSGRSWSAWAQVPAAGVVTSSPSAVLRGGAVEVYVRDGAGRVAVLTSPSRGTWGALSVVGGAVLAGTGPAATADAAGVRVSVVGTDRAVYTLLRGERAWRKLGGGAWGITAVASGGITQVVVRGTDNKVYAQQVGRTGWRAMRGLTAATPRAGVDAAGKPSVVVLGTNGALYLAPLTATATWTRVS